jgi:hypothetical protein
MRKYHLTTLITLTISYKIAKEILTAKMNRNTH